MEVQIAEKIPRSRSSLVVFIRSHSIFKQCFESCRLRWLPPIEQPPGLVILPRVSSLKSVLRVPRIVFILARTQPPATAIRSEVERKEHVKKAKILSNIYVGIEERIAIKKSNGFPPTNAGMLCYYVQ